MNTEQQQTLHKRLMMPLQHQEVYNEIYDHFQEAIQADMQQGISFQEALEEQYNAFGGTAGLEKIETDYMSSYRFRYLRLFRDQWKSIPITHLLIVVLLLVTYSLLTSLWEFSWHLIVLSLGLIPALLMFYEIFRQKNFFKSPFRSLRSRGLSGTAFISVFFTYCLIYGSNLQFVRDWYSVAPAWFFYLTITFLGLNLSAYWRLVKQTRNDRIPLSLPSYRTGKHAT